MQFDIPFSGHKNVLATHKKTIEITCDSNLTPRGDCIAGVSADHACDDIPPALKDALRDPQRTVYISITVDGHKFDVVGKGHNMLTLTHKHDIVIRKSTFVCSRTLAVGCDKASDDIPDEMRHALQNPDARGMFTIRV